MNCIPQKNYLIDKFDKKSASQYQKNDLISEISLSRDRLVLKFIIAFLNFIIISSLAQVVQFSDAPKTVFHTLKIGAGGFIHNLDIQCDQGIGRCAGSGTTTKVARTDTYGAYWLNPNAACGNDAATGCWQQLITATSFPDSLFNTCFEGCGAYEIRIAPSNTAHFYMY